MTWLQCHSDSRLLAAILAPPVSHPSTASHACVVSTLKALTPQNLLIIKPVLGCLVLLLFVLYLISII